MSEDLRVIVEVIRSLGNTGQEIFAMWAFKEIFRYVLTAGTIIFALLIVRAVILRAILQERAEKLCAKLLFKLGGSGIPSAEHEWEKLNAFVASLERKDWRG